MSNVFNHCHGNNHEQVNDSSRLDDVRHCHVMINDRLLFDCSYYEQCSEILSSVRKMEDSIRRLRHVRESSKALSTMTQSSTVNTTATGTGTSLSDDNKIRLQIQYDVQAYTNEVGDMYLSNVAFHCRCFLPRSINLALTSTHRIN
jgi:hypothetical protein